MLGWTVYISFLSALGCFLMPAKRPDLSRRLALVGTLISALIALVCAATYSPVDGNSVVDITKWNWIPSLGISYYLAADGISMVMVALTGIASVAAVLFSWNIEERANEFFGFFLTLIGGVYGVFISFDLFLLFVFYEIAIIPKYFLIALWGSTRKSYAAMKLVLYSFVGSSMALIGIMAAFVVSGSVSFDLQQLILHPYAPEFQRWAFPVTFIGFVILAGLWPFHTWAPTGHVAAPTGASMLLAGVVMKLGAYGALRVPMTLFPMGASIWREEIALLAAIGIVAGALVALVQNDFKFIIGYSSVSHMGFVLLGLLATTETGLNGAVLQMFSHGILAGLLFAVVGRMVYSRTHTRDLSKLETMQVGKQLPFAATIFLIAALASVGMPGFSGFVAELHVITGAWSSYSYLALMAGLGVILGVAYSMRALFTVFWPSASAREPEIGTPLSGLTIQEKTGAILLVTTSLVIGIYPRLLLDIIAPSLQSPLLKPLLDQSSTL
jgi:NADH-quinone oxidoreductase subunit M